MRGETLFERMSKIARGERPLGRGPLSEIDQLRQPAGRRRPDEIPMPGRKEGQ